jgi:protein subunit release factor A
MSDILPAEDMSIELLRKHPEGGQHAGSPPMLMKVTHKPSGITVILEQRSQHRARSLAYEMIECALTSPTYQP